MVGVGIPRNSPRDGGGVGINPTRGGVEPGEELAMLRPEPLFMLRFDPELAAAQKDFGLLSGILDGVSPFPLCGGAGLTRPLTGLDPGLTAGLLLALYGPTGGSIVSRSWGCGRSSPTGCSFNASPSLRMSPPLLEPLGVSRSSGPPMCNSGSTSLVVYSGDTLLAAFTLSLSLLLQPRLLPPGDRAS